MRLHVLRKKGWWSLLFDKLTPAEVLRLREVITSSCTQYIVEVVGYGKDFLASNMWSSSGEEIAMTPEQFMQNLLANIRELKVDVVEVLEVK